MIHAVLFDMDGTLFDTERLAKDGWLAAGKQMGITLSPEVVLSTNGTNAADTRAIILPSLPRAEDYDALYQLHREYAQDQIRQHGVPVKSGIRETLVWLSERRYRLAVASSSRQETIRAHLSSSGLLPYFDAIVGGDMVEHGKPAPDIFLRAARLLSVPPADCLVVEDSSAGLLAAQRAGMGAVMIPDLLPPTDRDLARCRACLSSAADLPALLEADARTGSNV